MNRAIRIMATLLAATGLACAGSAAAEDSFGNTIGGGGGRNFVLRCPAGALLTGIRSWAGAYINGVSPLCDGKPLDDMRFTRVTIAGGNQSAQSDTGCPDGSYVGRMRVYVLYSDNHLVDSIVLQCRSRQNPAVITGEVKRLTMDSGRGSMNPNTRGLGMDGGLALCLNGKKPVGLQGAAGDAIDRLGFVCA